MGEEPPCDNCSCEDLLKCNQFAWMIWKICHEFERPIDAGMGGVMHKPVPARSMIAINDAYGGTERDLEKVMLIERKMLPFIREQAQQDSSN